MRSQTEFGNEQGITKTALENFFNILQQEKIAPEDYDHTLRQIAERYHNLLNVATSLNNLSGLYRVQGLYSKAELLLQRALKILEKVVGKKSPSHQTCTRKLQYFIS
ncbi:MAG: tetratricopeptide repeat protein [Methylococcales bacterium]|nr:tetratricopeptide repeat protein [Methylococcales bacterium]